MARNYYYSSAHWRELRRAVLNRDGHRCVVPGCGRIATHVDHVKTRPNVDWPTEFDVMENCRSLCVGCDGQVKERQGGRRGQNGRFRVGCDASGCSLDPNHGWNRSA